MKRVLPVVQAKSISTQITTAWEAGANPVSGSAVSPKGFGFPSATLADDGATVSMALVGKKPKEIRYARYSNTADLAKVFAQIDDPQTHENLKEVISQVIKEFLKQQIKTRANIHELIPLAACVDSDISKQLYEAVIRSIEESKLPPIDLMMGLSRMLAISPKDQLKPEDLVAILSLLQTKMDGLHKSKRGSEPLMVLLRSVGMMLDAMLDQGLDNLSKERTVDPLKALLGNLAKHPEVKVAYLASYALEGLRRTPSDEPKEMVLLRKTLLVIEIFGGIASLVVSHGADLSAVIKIAGNFHSLFNEIGTIIDVVETAAQGVASSAMASGDVLSAVSQVEMAYDTAKGIYEQAQADYEETQQICQSLQGSLDQLRAIFPAKKAKISWYRASRAVVDLIGIFGGVERPSLEEFEDLMGQIKLQLEQVNQEYFAYGVTESLLSLLKNLPEASSLTRIFHHKRDTLDFTLC